MEDDKIYLRITELCQGYGMITSCKISTSFKDGLKQHTEVEFFLKDITLKEYKVFVSDEHELSNNNLTILFKRLEAELEGFKRPKNLTKLVNKLLKND